MAKRNLGTGMELATRCWDLLRNNREWLMFPLISTVGVFAFTVVYALIMAVMGIFRSLSDGQLDGSQSVMGVILLFIYYLVTYTIVTYSNTALVSVVLMKIRGDNPDAKAADGFKVANERIGAIIGYAALSATVGMIARGIAQAGRDSKNIAVAIITSILASIVQAAWNLVTFLVVPIIVVENLDTFGALRRSWDLFKKTWGEQVVGNFSLGFLGCLLSLAAMAPGLLIGALGGVLSSPLLLIGGGVVLVVGLAFISLLLGAVTGIFQAVMYQYATTGETGELLPKEMVQQAFVAK
jgi:hypothetical protein